MKKNTTNQEILLLPGSTCFKKDWCENEINPQSKKLSQKEQLIQLCWNGMLPDMLPEICETTYEGKALGIWDVSENKNLLEIRMGEFNELMIDEYSINPALILLLAETN